MKLIIFSILLFINSLIFSQYKSSEQNPVLTYKLRNIKFINSNTGYAVGENYMDSAPAKSIILKTTNGGESWTGILTYLSLAKSVSFAGNGTGFIAGSEGKFLKTTNEGHTWKYIYPRENITINSIFCTCADTAYAIGKGIQKTTNGGKSWIWQNSDSTNRTFNSVYFINNDIGYAAGQYGSIIKTTNGGNNWIKSNSGSITSNGFNSIFFLDKDNGFIAGGRNIIKTKNGGENWTLVFNNSGYELTSIHFVNKYIGYAAGKKGKIVKTTDGGITWVNQNNGIIKRDLYSVSFSDENTGYIAGDSCSIFKTTDGGQNWVLQTNITSGGVYGEDNGQIDYGDTDFPASDINVRWLRINELQAPFFDIGAECEMFFTEGNENFFSWPSQYGLQQNTMRSKGFWIGCKDYYDPYEEKVKNFKVISAGPQPSPSIPYMIFNKEIKLAGRNSHPQVYVNNQPASVLEESDKLDIVNEKLPCDRMITIKFNTSVGISVTKKVMAFAQSNHENYFINEYVFKNTGIVDWKGTKKEQTLKDVWFYWLYRFAFAGESCAGYGQGWGAWSDTWGSSTIYHSIGEDINNTEYADPTSPVYKMRGFYTWRGPNNERPVTYDEDWGLPNENGTGIMAAAKYNGALTLHADTSPQNLSDDETQPQTTWYVSPDVAANPNIAAMPIVSQYNDTTMKILYNMISEGHTKKQHDVVVGNDYPIYYSDPKRQVGGGTSQGQGYGPYTLAPGDSIHIVFAEAVAGLSREKNREVGYNWVKWRNNEVNKPQLILPDGPLTNDQNLYKRKWVETCKDSIIKTFRNAKNNYESGYSIPLPPPPPDKFNISSGEDKITMSWTNNAESFPGFNGYKIFRAEGKKDTSYELIYECNKTNTVNIFEDKNVNSGIDYYYYIQSKDDGSTNDIQPGVPLVSSKYYTMTNLPVRKGNPTSIEDNNSNLLPKEYKLYGNYPNPFNPVTKLRYALPLESFVKVAVFNVLGEKVCDIFNSSQIAGYHEIVFDASKLSSGIYLYTFDANAINESKSIRQTKKMVLCR